VTDSVAEREQHLKRPKNAVPATYSISVTGVVSTLSRLRLQVSSMNPVPTAIWLWNKTWNIMIPAMRYGVPACESVLVRAT